MNWHWSKSQQVAIVFGLIVVLILGLLGASSLTLARNAPLGDNTVHWDELYHNAPTGYNPETELVPGESFHFREVKSDGSADFYILALDGDLSTAWLYWQIEADGWAHHEVEFTRLKSLTADFHGIGSKTYELWRATITGRENSQQVYYRIRTVDGSAQAILKNNDNTSEGKLENPLGQWVWANDNPYTEGNWGYIAVNSGGGGEGGAHDNDIQWNHLYHNDPAAYNPQTEDVPGSAPAFRVLNGDGSADVYLIALAGDLTAANLIWEASDAWGQHNWLAMSTQYTVTVDFHNKGNTPYEVWHTTIPVNAQGVSVYYRIQANDGTATAWLKNTAAPSGTYSMKNPLGQWIWSGDVASEGNWSYTLTSGPPPTPTPSPTPIPTPNPPPTTTARTVFVHLFEWKWADIAQECENFLGPMGYSAVQVSPPQDHRVIPASGYPWWQRYQPVSYELISRSGDRAAFQNMVERCYAVGVDIYVDAIINHMTGLPNGVTDGPSSAGNTVTCSTISGNNCVANYPQVPYSASDFNLDRCNHNIVNWDDPWEARMCELLGLDDLRTDSSYVRGKTAEYLNDLISLGVAGFRIDAAKHMYPADLVAIKALLNDRPTAFGGGEAYIFQEVIQSPLSNGSDYLHIGDVTEFGFSNKVGSEFNNGSIAWLQGLEQGRLPSDGAVVFTDNHDNQRGHGGGGGVITHKNPEVYRLANVFALAYPYGYPKVMSSYYFTNGDQGPPSDGSGNTRSIYVNGQPDGCSVSGGWVCEHRWPAIASMVAFRNFTNDYFYVTDWWTNGNDQIAFGRGAGGFVVINREGSALNRTFQTSLAPGDYCDILHGGLSADGRTCTGATLTVGAGGTLPVSIAAMDAIAVHIGARPGMYDFPSVTITQPADGATLSGAFDVIATATHESGIAQVNFYVDGVVVGTDTTTPYGVTLNTDDYAPGARTLQAVALANDGLQGADSITFNILIPPVVSITHPEDGAMVSGSFVVTATATHPQGVTRVDFYIDDVLVGSDNNPTAQQVAAPAANQLLASKTIDGLASDWSQAQLVAAAPAHNSAQVAAPCTSGPYCRDGHTWSTHERQVDFVGLFADWDTEYLYVGIQGADVIDIEDPVNANSGDFVNTWNMIMFVGLDTGPGGYSTGASGDMWGKPQRFAGANQLNYQVYFASNFWQGPFLRHHDGVGWDPVDTAGQGLLGASSRGSGTSFVTGTPVIGPNGRNYITDGHDTNRNTFWEVRIPLDLIGNPDLDNGCIEIFVGHGDYSGIDSIPADPATLDTAGVSQSNSPLEWSDQDTYTVPFAKVGNGTECGSTPPSEFAVTLNAGDYDPGLHTLEARAVAVNNAEASDSISILVGDGPNLTQSAKTVNAATAYAGDTLTYTITLRNTGNQAANVVLTDTLPTQVTVMAGSLPGGMTQSGGQLLWSGTVNAGATTTLSFRVTVNAGVQNITAVNSVVIAGGGALLTRTASTSIGASGPNLSTSTKTVLPTTALAGEELTYTIALRNTGNQAATVRITDTLPSGVTVVAGSLPGGMTQTGNRLTWNGTVNAGATTSLVFNVEIDAGVEGVTLLNSVQISDGAGLTHIRQASTTVPGAGPCGGATVGDGNVVTAEVYHSNQEVAYRDPVGSVSMLVSPTLRLRTCRNDVSQVQVLVWQTGEPLEGPGTLLNAVAEPSGAYDYWTVEVPPPGVLINQWYQFKVVDGSTTGFYNPVSGNDGPGKWYTAATQQNPSWSLPRNDDGPPPPPDCDGVAVGDNQIRSTPLYHIDTDLTYRDPLGSIAMGESALMTLRTCKNDVQTVTAWVWKTGAGANPSYTYTATVAYSDSDYDYWQMVVPAPDVFTDQWYQFKVVDGAASGYYHPRSGNTGPGAWSVTGPGSSWKLGTTAGPLPPVENIPAWIQDAVIYQIFPDRFYNGNTANDALIEGTEVYGDRARPGCDGYPHARPGGLTDGCIHDLRGWSDPLLIPSWGMDYHGGDLQGITAKINAGYFNDLGVNTLYLNPIFEASSNHGYDTNDYYSVRDYFGGDAAFDEFLMAAKANGLRVILDAVFNHVGMDSSYIDWKKVNYGACEAVASPYRAWFIPGNDGAVFQCASGWGWKGWYGYGTIPEVVDDNDDVRDFFFRGGSPQIPGFANGMSVSEYWIDKGIDGWRYDVAQDISNDWFREMRPYIKEQYGSADILMLGEVTGGCAAGGLYEAYTRGDQLDSVMNYCFRDWMAGFASGNSPEFFANSFDDFRAQYPPEIFYAMMNLISTHDSPRLFQMVGSDYTNLKLAVLLQMMLPGAPSVYYGDEVGLPGGSDPDNRRTYPWGNAPDPTMYNHFKTVIGIRNTYSALRGGDYQRLLAANNIYAFARWDTEDTVIVALRNIASSANATLSVSAYFADGTVLTDVLNNNATYTVSGGNVVVPVNGKWGVVLVGPGQEVVNHAPYTPSAPSPAHLASNIAVNVGELRWSGGDPDGDVVTYTVYFGTNATPPLAGTVRNVARYALPTLAEGTTYYWRISASDGDLTADGPVWRFTTVAASPVNQPPYAPSEPAPAYGATDVPTTTATLSWSGGDPDAGDTVAYTVYFGVNPTPPQVGTVVDVTTFNLGVFSPLTADATYYWRIVASDGMSTTTGPVWHFTTAAPAPPVNQPPYTPANPAPAHMATNVPLNPILSWTGGDPDVGDTVTYVVAFGTNSTPPVMATGVGVAHYNPGALAADTLYYWRITASDGLSETVGPLWSFTTGTEIAENRAPYMPGNPVPAHNATHVPTMTATLSWSGGDPDADVVTYTVYFGTNTTPPEVGVVVDVTTLNLGALSPLAANTIYYWQIVASDGISTTTGPLWQFTTAAPALPVNQPPYAPFNPTPAHEAINVSLNALLGWSGGDPDGDVVTYTVAFGTDATPPVVATGVSGTSYNPGALTLATTYYWQITVTDGVEMTVGPVWTFTTVANRIYLPLVLRDQMSMMLFYRAR